MITAIDTNVLLDVFLAEREQGPSSRHAVLESLARGSLIACGVVWAEVATFFRPDPAAARNALELLEVSFSPVDEVTAISAAGYWQAHWARRGSDRRIAADFLVGAHALLHADRLLTRDRGFYRTYFEGLTVVDPSQRA